jgi:hypothetical protein
MPAVIRVANNQRRALLGAPLLPDLPGLSAQDLPQVTLQVFEDYVSLTQTPTITAGAYTLGAAVGGLLTFTGAVNTSGGRGQVTALVLLDKAQQHCPLELVLFDHTFTATADQSAFNPSSADMAYCIGVVAINPEHYRRFSGNSVAVVPDLSMRFVANGSANLYGQLVCRGVPTYASTSDLSVRLTVRRDA